MILGKKSARLGIALVCGIAAASWAWGALAAPRASDAGSNPPEGTPSTAAAPKIIPLCVPIGLASYKGLLFVANHWTSGGCSAPGQILVYSSKGVQIPKRTITADIDNPAGLAFDSKGNLYVADATKDQVTVYSPTGVQLKGKRSTPTRTTALRVSR